MAVLTDEQKKTIDELKGARFELDMRALFMGGRGGNGGPPGGDGGGRQRGDGGGRGNRPPAE